jgi:hypothetical protein
MACLWLQYTKDLNPVILKPVIPVLWESEAGGLQIGGQPWLSNKILSQKNKKTKLN